MSKPFVGIDSEGLRDALRAWRASLNSAHDEVIAALNNYRAVALQHADMPHGSHVADLNKQCDSATSGYISGHNDLHAQYITLADAIAQPLGPC